MMRAHSHAAAQPIDIGLVSGMRIPDADKIRTATGQGSKVSSTFTFDSRPAFELKTFAKALLSIRPAKRSGKKN